MNLGGWLLLTGIFGFLMLVIQRVELKRRIVTALIMAFVGGIVWRYGVYRIDGECDLLWNAMCPTLLNQQLAAATAITTVNRAVLSALVVNLIYWALFGRYNPVGSSDSIKVLGLYDD